MAGRATLTLMTGRAGVLTRFELLTPQSADLPIQDSAMRVLMWAHRIAREHPPPPTAVPLLVMLLVPLLNMLLVPLLVMLLVPLLITFARTAADYVCLEGF